ncbi:uncharacterized protein LOC143540928 [Bidens hawaiensis]|uniref:uncharacterized protein LOC143540928 n=1 Tax=Bidens hawaiensis TaxID=980011 RepID=UPI0040496C3A
MVEAFSNMISKAVADGIFKGFRTPNRGPVVSHLLYADDAMLLREWSETNLVKDTARVIGCKSGMMPFLHLGISVGANVNKVNNWNRIVDVFEKRLAVWKAHSLSIGGRVVLIKSVLESLPVYYFSLFKVPDKVVENLEI